MRIIIDVRGGGGERKERGFAAGILLAITIITIVSVRTVLSLVVLLHDACAASVTSSNKNGAGGVVPPCTTKQECSSMNIAPFRQGIWHNRINSILLYWNPSTVMPSSVNKRVV